MRNEPGGAQREGGLVRKLVSIAGGAVGLLGVIFVVRILLDEWDEIEPTIRSANGGPLALSVLVGIAGMGWIGLRWRKVIELLGWSEVPYRTVLSSYYLGQIGKYVPGGVWPVLGRAELVSAGGVPRRTAYPSVGLSMATTYLAAVLLSAGAAPFALRRSDGAHAWVLLALPVGLLLLHPAVMGRVIALGERFFSRGEPIRVPAWREALLLVLSHLPAWILISAATWLVARSLGVSDAFAIIVFATPLAWAAGLAAIPVPGGVGVREAVFIALTAGVLDSATAATIAVLARLVFVVGDLTAAVVAAAMRRQGDSMAARDARPRVAAPRSSPEDR